MDEKNSDDVLNSFEFLQSKGLGQLGADTDSASEWLQIGTSRGCSLVPLFRPDGVVGFGIFFAEAFEKVKSLTRALEESQNLVKEAKCEALFKKLRITEQSVRKVTLQRASSLIPLPCATVLKEQLHRYWNANTQTYEKSNTLQRRISISSQKQYGDFPILTFWSSHLDAIPSFISGLVELDVGSMTAKGLKNFNMLQELWNLLTASVKNEKMELVSSEEIISLFPAESFYGSTGRRKMSSQSDKSVRDSDDRFGLELSKVFGVMEKKSETSADLKSSMVPEPEYFTLPMISEPEFCRFAMYFGVMFSRLAITIFEPSRSFFNSKIETIGLLRFRFGASFVASVAKKFLKPSKSCNVIELEAALQNRKRLGSWAFLGQAFSGTTYVPLVPSLLCSGQFSTPAILRPEIAILKKADQKKKMAQTQNPFMTCEDFLDGKISLDFWESPAGRTIPFVAEQILLGLLQLVRSMPGFYQNFEFLNHGKVKSFHSDHPVPDDASDSTVNVDEILHRFDKIENIYMHATQTYSVGFNSVFGLPLEEPTSLGLYDGSKFPAGPLDLNVVHTLESIPVQLNLQFRPKRDGGLEKIFDAILKVFSATSAATRAEIRENMSEGSPFNLEDLEYVPVFTFEVDGKVFTEDEWLTAQKTKTGYLIGDGIVLQKESYERCLEVYHHRQRALVRFGTLKVRDLWRASRVSAPSGDQKLVPEEYLRYVQTQLKGLGDESDAQFVKEFSGQMERLESNQNSVDAVQLRPYQKLGVGWILSRFAMGLGCCLADEMGLGKTAQALQVLKHLHLGILSFLHSRNPVDKSDTDVKRSLVVCPKSLGLNWMREFSIWAPALRVQFVEGQPLAADADVVVTTYARLRLRAEEWATANWLCVVLDEAHNIKNHTTSQARSARNLPAKFRLALTGTPLENHPRELWSLLDWLNEGWLGDVTSFDLYTRLARSKAEKNLMLAPLRSMISPVLLRRLKNDSAVALDLPEKIERIIDLELSEEQSVLYEAVILTALGAQSASGLETVFEKSSRYLKAILHAKQICNHPENFLMGDEDGFILDKNSDFPEELKRKIRKEKTRLLKRRGATALQKSGSRCASSDSSMERARSTKLQALLELLTELKDSDGGILIFTQFKKSAAIICSAIEDLSQEYGIKKWEKVPYLGSSLSVAERETVVAEFQLDAELVKDQGPSEFQDAPPILVLSLKTGGVGLNLTGATQVIHFDRWWNPAVEAQATDRAHRIGQKRTVSVTHFRASGTIEEGIAKLMDSKKLLAHDFLAEASLEGAHESLRDELGFLKLVDPKVLFSRNRMMHEQMSQMSQVNPSFTQSDAEVSQ